MKKQYLIRSLTKFKQRNKELPSRYAMLNQVLNPLVLKEVRIHSISFQNSNKETKEI
jgi:hypothetical protein